MASNERKMMDNALKKVVIPVLRKLEFKGSLPHLRRKNENNIDLITFQFNRWGGSFIVELATCPTEGVTMYWGEQIPPNKVTAHHIYKRLRLGAESEDEDGIWFDFENAKTEEEFEKVAMSVLGLFNTSDRLWISKLFN
ncbi:DUF4304 domain-containing protein [Peribacillus simplex]|uniref:DUF4304 domain-containing protein n=2 Tax=Peribacillus simplex TaxID=1478 RepID=A0A223EB80_9BACI|nr:DUF4304 domain-containing protein [Peribacillus simplex]ASS92519.1 hypothetical protein BS1321_00125 [Peribacillus simplex NBRC 15720 = DSM 1321]ASS97170.1 hypothetical protein BS1321_26720 [Peribacillus simplex NBRC 15720 = DSM 1321]MEC1400762.1 DUF4304 domain-containing protein [Peribacillus simplex]MED3912499.1 DUF4304 domain-containing protein [Peribacillus simplex]TVX75809.1 DUF4304 domain-containing protein [Peribacillus simplex]